MTGHLDEFWPDIRDSGWIGGDAEGWERAPYWLDGLIPLAFILDDERRLPDWQLCQDAAAPPPPSPVTSGELPDELALTPYGCTNLRVTEFPVLGE